VTKADSILYKRLLFGAFHGGWTAGRGDMISDETLIEEERACSDAFIAWIDGKEREPLYEIAREITHRFGHPWTDPRTGVTYPPPKRRPR